MGKRAETILMASRTRAAYDHRGRMVSKRITENDGHDTLVKSTTYLWDGWNIIRETQWPVTSDQWSVGPLATNHYPLVTDYVWGLDLDGTLQGAGGVGGLLAVVRDGETYLPTYDANGNMLTDGRFRYTWNAENRLVRAQELVAPTNRHPYTVSYAYDHRV